MKTTANGITTQYELEGPPSAPVVTLSHSLAASLHLWDAQAVRCRPLSRAPLRYPRARRLRRAAGAIPTSIRWTTTSTVSAGPRHRETHFVGLSMGGLIGMTLALKFPRAVRSLVLADTTASYGPERKPMWDDRIRVAETKGIDGVLDRTMEAWFTAPYRAARPDVIAAPRLPRYDPSACRRDQGARLTAIYAGHPRDPCPTLILWARRTAAPT